jgi:hypothetical protein
MHWYPFLILGTENLPFHTLFYKFHFEFFFFTLTTNYFFCSTREDIKFPVLPPNWNVGVGITFRRQNSET